MRGDYLATREHASILAEPSAKGEYTYYLRVDVDDGGMSHFSYSRDGEEFTPLGVKFQAQKGVWIGAKMGIFSLSPNVIKSSGYADFDWFRVH